ncbi:hypothetical protein B0T17DRAFT_525603 [Bombardia bombarda]|uniref:Secreted protein n=1 Tax=Bombardia bombarda TaxID=252184 RepID=A0AA40C8I7_9PEZI|nr:hypothetical protein B0T17DRAFT_525603 [Bombardia bombarda]
MVQFGLALAFASDVDASDVDASCVSDILMVKEKSCWFDVPFRGLMKLLCVGCLVEVRLGLGRGTVWTHIVIYPSLALSQMGVASV